jgi:8-oxo-dGTP diphosphatase
MERTERVTLTNMCMIQDGSRVLVQDKVSGDWPGTTFPGGHVEKGESFTNAVIREVLEETGLAIARPRLVGIKNWSNDDDSRYMVLLYKTSSFTGELRSSDEGEVYWIEMDDLYEMPLAYDMQDLLKVFMDDDLSEFQYYQEDGVWKYHMK